MSMPGFVFHFCCDTCSTNSDEYSVFPFPDLLTPDICLPAWSCRYQCWSWIRLSFSPDQRADLEDDPQRIVQLAASLSSEVLTVCVPSLIPQDGEYRVTVTPEPQCPHCDRRCRVVFGYPSRDPDVRLRGISAKEIHALPIAASGLSVRTRQICLSLGIVTIGQLQDRREEFSRDRRASEASIAEVARLFDSNERHPQRADNDSTDR